MCQQIIKNTCYLLRQSEIAAWEGSLHRLSCDKVGDVLKGEQRPGTSPPGAEEAGKDSWALGMKPDFLLRISLGQRVSPGSEPCHLHPFWHMLG